MFESEGAKIAVLEHQLDVQFISMCEMNDSETKYARIDSDVVDMLKSDEDSKSNEDLIALFKDSVGNDKLEVKFEALKDESVPALITLSEESRRMEEMMKMYASMGMNMGADFPVEYTLVLNSNSDLIAKLESVNQTDSEKAKLMALEIYRLALMSQKRMSADELKAFLADSFRLLGML